MPSFLNLVQLRKTKEEQMQFPRANTATRTVLISLVERGPMTIDDLMAIGQTPETKQRNRLVRVLASLCNAGCAIPSKDKFQATEDAIAYAEDLIEMQDKKPKLDFVAAPYFRIDTPELRGYTKRLYQNKRGYD